MRSLQVVLCSAVVSACLDAPAGSDAAVARLIVAWDPLACGDPHRIAVELEDDVGAVLSASTPCTVGVLTLDVGHVGSYRGRIYAWAIDAPIRSVAPVALTIDQPVVHWDVATPP